jgi:hypothetical protein
MIANTSDRRPPAVGRVQHWEFLVCEDGLEGPGAAIADLLRLINLLASMRGSRREPLAWQWTDAEGRAARRRAGHGPRARRPDVLVCPAGTLATART